MFTSDVFGLEKGVQPRTDTAICVVPILSTLAFTMIEVKRVVVKIRDPAEA